MPICSEIVREIRESHGDDDNPDFDRLRREYLLKLSYYTNRNIILYFLG